MDQFNFKNRRKKKKDGDKILSNLVLLVSGVGACNEPGEGDRELGEELL